MGAGFGFDVDKVKQGAWSFSHVRNLLMTLQLVPFENKFLDIPVPSSVIHNVCGRKIKKRI